MLHRPRAACIALSVLLCGHAPVVLGQAVTSGGAAGQRMASGAVAGLVYDSVAGAPLAGAVVQMRAAAEAGVGHYYAATTDSAGHYTLANVVAGSYLVTFFHPALDALGLESLLHRVVVSADTVTRLDLTVPSPGTVWRLTCQPTSARDSTGLVLGEVRDAESQTPMVGAEVTARWSALSFEAGSGIHVDQHELKVKTDSVGRYAMCGVPAGGDVELQAGQGAATSGPVLAVVPGRALLQQPLAISGRNTREVLLADSAGLDSGTVVVRGTARLAGEVRSQSGQPLKDVELHVLGTAVDGRSADDGTFLLTGLPAGSYLLETRRVGLAPAQATVMLASGQTAHVDVTMQEAVQLSRQTIYGKARMNGALERLGDFLHRKKLGFGRFLTRKDIERRVPFHTSDVFRDMVEVKVVNPPGHPHEGAALMRDPRGWCQANVFLDGAWIIKNLGPGGVTGGGDMDGWVQPDDIAAVEVYPMMSLTPAQFRGFRCGSIVIWTTHTFPDVPSDR